jgi:polysaccharide export outer membrane protein
VSTPTPAASTPEPFTATPGHFLLPAASFVRSARLEDIARQADRQTVYGYELANRGAYFAARAEFTAALRLVAQGLDNEQHTGVHGQALSAALTALKEVKDLLPCGAKLEAEIDLPAIVAGHRTPVLQGVPADDLRPMAAVKSYFTFAQEQLAAAAGHEVAGSMALTALGKLHAAMARQKCVEIPAAESKAIVFFQAAMLVFPRNYLAANELGVLLAHSGNSAEARRALEHSVGVYAGSVNLANLAVIYQQLGQPQWALAARQQAEAARRSEEARLRGMTGSAGGMVQWVPPAALAQTGVPAVDPPRSPQPASPAPRAGQPTPTVRPATAPAVPPPAAPAGLTADEFPAPALAWLSPFSNGGQARLLNTSHDIVLCQALGPAAPCPICGVDCSVCQGRCRGWEQARAIAWQAYAQGEYAGHARTAHVPEYRIRVDDALEMMYRLTRDQQPDPYQLNVGDEVKVESFADPAITASVFILPDGTITLRLLGPVHAAGQTVAQLRDRLEELYKKYYKVPSITVTPTKFDTRLEDLRATVDRRAGVAGGQALDLRVTPEGTVALPAIGSVPAQGLTLPELQKEINERYRQTIEGIEVMPILTARAPRYVYVIGEVHNPGRFEMVGPTTILQAVSLAGSWNVGANLCQIVVFRRGDDWRLMASMVNLEGALRGKQACPPGEIWLNDSDVIIVPKSHILEMDDVISLAFTRGFYGVLPLQPTITFQKLSTI